MVDLQELIALALWYHKIYPRSVYVNRYLVHDISEIEKRGLHSNDVLSGTLQKHL